MGFLKRLLKTPDEDQDEAQDEFNAEQNGLLMVPSLPGDNEGQAPLETAPADDALAEAPPEEGEPASPTAQGEADVAQDELAPAPEGQGDPPDLTDGSPAAEGQGEQAAANEAQATEESSSDDPMALFRATAVTHIALPSALMEAIGDVSAADLLAEARSVRNSLLGGQTGGGAEQRGRDAA